MTSTSESPRRIQRRRTKGWRMPPNTVSVTRPGPWGNPFNFTSSEYSFTALTFDCRADKKGRAEAAVKAFIEWIGTDPKRRTMEFERGLVLEGPKGEKISIGARAQAGPAPSIESIRTELRGKNLACFCHLCPTHVDGKPLGVACAACAPCHADVLIEIANASVCEAIP
jgi:hypothetical protein